MVIFLDVVALTAPVSFPAPPQVRDQEIPMKRNFAKVVIHVEDCNDHSPAFLSPRYEASISNLAPTGSEVVRVKALDKDMGSNADISYSLQSGEQRPIFTFHWTLAPFSPPVCFTCFCTNTPMSGQRFLILIRGIFLKVILLVAGGLRDEDVCCVFFGSFLKL